MPEQRGELTATELLNIRKGSNRAAEILHTVEVGSTLRYVGWEDGESIDGNAKWFKDANGNYFWSGGTDIIPEATDSKVVKVNWNREILGIDESWRSTGGGVIKVAILDSGITRKHPDFHGAIGEKNIKDFANAGGTGEDVVGHGTHCAGLIGARNSSRNGVVGIAPKCELLIAKVQKDGWGFRAGPIASGIAWARKEEADIISMSFSTSDIDDNELKSEIGAAVRKGIVLVAAAGNNEELFDDTLLYPAMFEGVLAIGAISDETLDKRAGRSFHKKLDFVLPYGKYLSSWKEPDMYKEEDGCSMAAAVVSGIATLILSATQKKNDSTLVKKELTRIAPAITADFRFGDRFVVARP